MKETDCLIQLTHEEVGAVHCAVIGSLLATEEACKKSNDINHIPYLMRIIANLNAAEEKLAKLGTLPQGRVKAQSR
jgi:hypothetical protein